MIIDERTSTAPAVDLDRLLDDLVDATNEAELRKDMLADYIAALDTATRKIEEAKEIYKRARAKGWIA